MRMLMMLVTSQISVQTAVHDTLCCLFLFHSLLITSPERSQMTFFSSSLFYNLKSDIQTVSANVSHKDKHLAVKCCHVFLFHVPLHALRDQYLNHI